MQNAHKSTVSSLQNIPNRYLLISGGFDGNVKSWDTNSWENYGCRTFEGHWVKSLQLVTNYDERLCDNSQMTRPTSYRNMQKESFLRTGGWSVNNGDFVPNNKKIEIIKRNTLT